MNYSNILFDEYQINQFDDLSKIDQLTDDKESSAETLMKFRMALIEHILKEMTKDTNGVQKLCRKKMAFTNSDLLGAREASSNTSSKASTALGATNGSDWFNDNVPDDLTKALEKFEKMLMWQQTHSTDISKELILLKYMAKLSKKDGADKFINADLVTTILKNLVAKKYIENGSIQDEINSLQSIMNGGSANMKKIMQDFISKYGKESYYDDHYKDKNGKKYSSSFFNIIAGGDLAFTSLNIVSDIIKEIYKERMEEILKQYLKCKNPYFYYLALLNVIGSKEQDTEQEVSGCANILKELSDGENKTGDASNALSVLINMITGHSNITIDKNNKYYDVVKSLKDSLKRFEDAHPNLIGIINPALKVLDNAYDSKTGTFKFSETDFSKLQTALKDIENYKGADSKDVQNFCITHNLSGISKDLASLDKQPLDQAQTLASALLFIKMMGDHFDGSIFPGLKDLTDKILGPNGDFYKIVGISEKDLEKAADGDPDAEQKMIDGFKKIISTKTDNDTSPISTINNEFNSITNFFNSKNSSEQAESQFISSNDQKMLSFMKQMYDMPVKLIAAIVQNYRQVNN